MTISGPPICTVCAHYHGAAKCDAFPEGIPIEIAWNSLDHRKPIEGDGGVQFALAQGQDEALARILKDLEWSDSAEA